LTVAAAIAMPRVAWVGPEVCGGVITSLNRLTDVFQTGNCAIRPAESPFHPEPVFNSAKDGIVPLVFHVPTPSAICRGRPSMKPLFTLFVMII
jgi:hypothetical protein